MTGAQLLDGTSDHYLIRGGLAGRITVAQDHWLLSNLSADRTYLVENPEGAGEHVKVAPRRLDAPIPFELARVVLPVDPAPLEFVVVAREPSG